MSNRIIPMDAVSGILSLLPVKSLLRFKSVSKEWCSFINEPYFIKLHLSQSMETNRYNRNIIFKDVESGKLLSVDFDSINFQNLKAINHPLKHLSGCGAEDDYGDIQVFGSCNGLLCLINKRYRIIELWNILTGITVLPDEFVETNKCNGEVWYFYGFGHDSIHDDYKIVRVAQEVDSINYTLISEVKVYSLKTNTWRKGEEIPYYFRNRLVMGTFICGALHWLAVEEREWECPSSIIAFDVGIEKYRQIELVDNIERNAYSMVPKALQGCLCIITTCFNNDVNIWMMKDYGVKDSWTILYSFQGNIPSAPHVYPLRPLAYSRTGDRLLLHHEGLSLLWYDLKENQFERVDLPQLKNVKTFLLEICVESLVQLGKSI
ncbi:LOW QUALITY PROTEIN: F-box protein CPR30 [Herrania umbratica]|uniref:LOW QUALITY PROTEIN: F-box protein CPR30 n=1 Tax=Herrania umbratica TaxID=108875 RepID=A0A6J1AF29_9ROSI|nr:LOW QUALITY PROTEIN: F-box protein CPR30 [Herrania umbratica]